MMAGLSAMFEGESETSGGAVADPLEPARQDDILPILRHLRRLLLLGLGGARRDEGRVEQ
jgi:hypothetical protein